MSYSVSCPDVYPPIDDLSPPIFPTGSPDDCLVDDIFKKSMMLLNTFAYDESNHATGYASSEQTFGSAWSSNRTSPLSCVSPTQQDHDASNYSFVAPIATPVAVVTTPLNLSSYTLSSIGSTGSNLIGGNDSLARLPSPAEIFGFRHNYYPNFDPKEYFCDTVAVENASMVAQIVGKKGAKIKHLVAKYGTRIRTPNVDQEPVFVIKGKRADVYSVKKEIMSAAAHFMKIEQGKREKLDTVMNSADSTSLKLFIPSKYVGLVIGRNGRVVRELQTNHKVFIETPKFDLRHFFRIFGNALAIQEAVQAIFDLLVKKSGICFTERRHLGDEVHFIE